MDAIPVNRVVHYLRIRYLGHKDLCLIANRIKGELVVKCLFIMNIIYFTTKGKMGELCFNRSLCAKILKRYLESTSQFKFWTKDVSLSLFLTPSITFYCFLSIKVCTPNRKGQ